MTSQGRVCGALGCRSRATAVVYIDGTGERVVCDRHANGGEVIHDV